MLAIDRYGVTIECEGIDASAEQVRARMASVFDRYVTDRSLYGVKDEARAAQRVLWADPDAVQPWQWRRAAALGECTRGSGRHPARGVDVRGRATRESASSRRAT